MSHSAAETSHPIEIPSPFAGKVISPFQHLILASYWFGANFVWGAFLGTVLSTQMQRLAPNNYAEMLGKLYAFAAIPAILVPLIIGPLSDRCTSKLGRRRPYILVGSIVGLVGLGIVQFGFQQVSLPIYISGYFLLQIGTNTALASFSGIIPDLVPENQRGTASGYMAVVSQVATLLGVILIGQLISKARHTEVFILIGGVYALFTVISLIGIKEPQVTVKWPKFDFVSYLKSLWIDPRTYPDFAWVWLTRALMMLGFYLIQPYIQFYLRDVVHVKDPAGEASMVIGLILIAATISGFVGGVISDKVGRKPVVIYSSVLISVMCVALAFCQNLNQALIAGIIFGLGYGAYISVDWALGADVLPSQNDSGKDMAVWHVAMTFPQQVAPLVGAMLLELFKGPAIQFEGKSVTSYAFPGYLIVFSLSAVFFFFGGVLVKKVKGAH